MPTIHREPRFTYDDLVDLVEGQIWVVELPAIDAEIGLRERAHRSRPASTVALPDELAPWCVFSQYLPIRGTTCTSSQSPWSWTSAGPYGTA
ncbi:hypothetical protein ACIP10_36945 [Streptomyces galbus]|uniref:hypothetical protein n=1 Tax=Streptomyces galbus TaxID=33898 RepID=UPI003828029A